MLGCSFFSLDAHIFTFLVEATLFFFDILLSIQRICVFLFGLLMELVELRLLMILPLRKCYLGLLEGLPLLHIL